MHRSARRGRAPARPGLRALPRRRTAAPAPASAPRPRLRCGRAAGTLRQRRDGREPDRAVPSPSRCEAAMRARRGRRRRAPELRSAWDRSTAERTRAPCAPAPAPPSLRRDRAGNWRVRREARRCPGGLPTPSPAPRGACWRRDPRGGRIEAPLPGPWTRRP